MELGYHIFKPYRRKGLAVEACRGIISHVKETLEEPVFLYAKIDASNEASIHVIQKLGFAFISVKGGSSTEINAPRGYAVIL